MANTQTATGTMTKVGETVVLTPVRYPKAPIVHVQVSGPAGAKVYIEVSPDGSNWYVANALRAGLQAGAEGGEITLLTTSIQLYTLRSVFGQRVRVRASSISSGTITATMDAPIVHPMWLLAPRLGLPTGSYRLPFSFVEPAIPGLRGVTAY